MQAVTVPTPGGPDVLTLTQVDEPTPRPDDVLIDVAAAGVNGADIAQRQGFYPSPAGAPTWPGLEVSGTVAGLGAEVTGFAVGDRVCALLGGGGYSERVAVDAQLVLPAPAGIDLVEAAGLPEVAATVWSNVFMAARLTAGETLLVHGGSSGIGTMAIQLAVALGSPVIATAGTDDKVEFCRSLGAVGVNYRTDDFVERVKDITGGAGVDVVLDMVGGDYIARDIRALALGGRIMSIANRSGADSTISINALMVKRGLIWGTTVRARPFAERAEIIAEVRANVWPLVESGRVRPIVDSVFPLERAADAHRRMESSAHTGKILLTI
ncbi:NAD(P)H-quinone oxidoreductase [Rathayibacter soli]|uniref:NAD(P)H-quinone oxidoreductase n=1 Tax=Rathayibacter soli TaxID=3144168 RepID=UPI0027E50A41|nr:NAD(P)H-quinone oxidoreductase [Glaciibacter superstes]